MFAQIGASSKNLWKRQHGERCAPLCPSTAHAPANDEQIAFECVGLAIANAKAAELRMSGDRDVILSLAKASEADDPTG